VTPEVAILAALPEEVSTLRRRLRDRYGARAGSTSLSLGTLGGWRVAAATGAIPGLAVTVPDLVVTPQDKASLRRAIPDEPAVVDLESSAVVAALADVGIPWIVLRAVTDTADEALPPIVRSSRDEQGLHRVRMVGNALRDPAAAADLWRLGRRMRACAHALATAAEQVLIAVESLPDIAAAR